MQKVVVFFGTRPEAIKLAPIVHALLNNENFSVLICSTGQHKEILQQVISFFGIPVHIDLDIMTPDQQLADLNAKLLVGINGILQRERPDFIIVQGDTTTTFVASQAAFYNKIKILHIEAGLRTFNKFSPFPEEINRVLTSRLADFHYSPTEQARKNLLNEGIASEKVLVTGNTGIDALCMALKKIENKIPEEIISQKLESKKKYILVTMHRRENHGTIMRKILQAIKKITEAALIPIIFPVHPNPNVKDVIQEILGNHPLIHLTPPLSYPAFLWLMKNAQIILTDSSGVQEEAPSFGKPVLLLRDTTEHPEAINAGTTLKTGNDPELLFETAMKLLSDEATYTGMAVKHNLYGDGFATEKIVTSILSMNAFLSNKQTPSKSLLAQ